MSRNAPFSLGGALRDIPHKKKAAAEETNIILEKSNYFVVLIMVAKLFRDNAGWNFWMNLLIRHIFGIDRYQSRSGR